jgi:uncharacterized membrane protein YqjE
MFCKYKNIFGKVGEGAHSFRLFDVAVVDVLLTILVSIIINYFYPKYRLVYILGSLFIMGMILHRIFCVRTTVDKLLFRHPRSQKKC